MLEPKAKRQGFLPFENNWFDRLFIGAITLIALHLAWIRLLEPLGLSLWICTAISVAVAVFIFRRG